MRTIEGRLDDFRRPIIDIALQPTRFFAKGVEPQPVPVVGAVSALRGLIDTGAGRTCITRSTARAIGLRPRGKMKLGSVFSIEHHNTFRFVLGAIYDDNGDRGYWWFDEVVGLDFRDNDDFQVLIGMDILSRGDLLLRRDGTFTWTLP